MDAAAHKLSRRSAIEAHLSGTEQLLRQVSPDAVLAIVEVLATARNQGRTVFTLGNGGSAATAMHLATDLLRASEPGRPMRVSCLAGNLATFSALANDYDYEQVFTRQLAALLLPKDVVIGISASGNSANCVSALSYSRQRGAITVGLVGFTGGKLKGLCDHIVHVPSEDYLFVEDVHAVVCHALSRALNSGGCAQVVAPQV